MCGSSNHRVRVWGFTAEESRASGGAGLCEPHGLLCGGDSFFIVGGVSTLVCGSWFVVWLQLGFLLDEPLLLHVRHFHFNCAPLLPPNLSASFEDIAPDAFECAREIAGVSDQVHKSRGLRVDDGNAVPCLVIVQLLRMRVLPLKVVVVILWMGSL